MTLLGRIGHVIALSGKLVRLFMQILYGSWKVTRLPQPVITIFGGARLLKTDFYFKQASQLTEQFVQADISVLTGGGPGLMEAANCGAFLSHSGKGRSMGIGVKGLEESKNPCLHEYFEVNYFFARKWLLTSYSRAFVVFPGGFGTLDELSEILTLIETGKMKRVPIVFVGREYWGPFVDWLTKEAQEHGLITLEAIQLFTVTDDLEKVFCLVQEKCTV